MADSLNTMNPRTDNVVAFVADDVEDYVQVLRAAMEGWGPPSNDRWIELMNPLLPSLRLAHITLVRLSRSEVQDAVRQLRKDREAMETLMYQFAWAGGWFEKMADICFAAERRMHEHGAPKASLEHLFNTEPEPKN